MQSLSRLCPGQYTATTDATVYLMRGHGDSRRQVNYSTYKAGALIEVPASVNGYWHALAWHPDLGEAAPIVQKTASHGLDISLIREAIAKPTNFSSLELDELAGRAERMNMLASRDELERLIRDRHPSGKERTR